MGRRAYEKITGPDVCLDAVGGQAWFEKIKHLPAPRLSAAYLPQWDYSNVPEWVIFASKQGTFQRNRKLRK
jgi:hypothetical protein